MATCTVCGNDYDKAFTVTMNGKSQIFDSFECAIHALAPRCAHCDLPVPAGLIEPDAETQFCCAGCRAVYGTLHACGLDAYYRLRDVAASPAKPLVDINRAAFARPITHWPKAVAPHAAADVEKALPAPISRRQMDGPPAELLFVFGQDLGIGAPLIAETVG